MRLLLGLLLMMMAVGSCSGSDEDSPNGGDADSDTDSDSDVDSESDTDTGSPSDANTDWEAALEELCDDADEKDMLKNLKACFADSNRINDDASLTACIEDDNDCDEFFTGLCAEFDCDKNDCVATAVHCPDSPFYGEQPWSFDTEIIYSSYSLSGALRSNPSYSECGAKYGGSTHTDNTFTAKICFRGRCLTEDEITDLVCNTQ